jgi:hypothetical protein
MAAIMSLYEPRPRGTVLGERADMRRVGGSNIFSDARRATAGSTCAIWDGSRTTKARSRTRHRMEFSSQSGDRLATPLEKSRQSNIAR